MNPLPKYFLLTIFFASKISLAQKPAFGIKLGIDLSNATINYTEPSTEKYYTKVGFLGGVYADVFLRKELFFRPGAEIVLKGVRQKYEGSSYDLPITFTYVDFPLNIVYKNNSGKGHLMAGGGPVIGVPINHSYNGYPLKTEFSINGLIGFELPIGFSVNFNYTYGLNNVSSDNQFISKISNRYLGITAGYTF
ncbi:MAG: outer membrane beta-barrel protein [Ginsengibacter sp.]